jgi:hypothetical protein
MVLGELKLIGLVKHGGMLFMLKDKLYTNDIMFSHAYSSSWFNKPTYFEWERELSGDHIILTDFTIHIVDMFSDKKVYGWLLESPEITPQAYSFVKHNYDKFINIFTFDKDLLTLSNKFILLPIGGCWIHEEDQKIHEKDSMVSIILSNKKTTIGHRLRHEILSIFSNLDSFGFNNPIENKITGLGKYRFSIIVENCKQDYYFTEKIIDSFITGTIPIYWGCPSIGKFFDIDGIICFNSIQELEKILPTLTIDLYNQKINNIKTNFELAKDYRIADDKIYKILKND